ncbi:MAG: DUF6691 family protein [Minwuia sp.]|uniref:DUF6691 family protein n=1 Tax=Minwuia sp. TaxID=2493630 RepID=UPI003A8A7964
MRAVGGLVTGLIFGAGLVISGMYNPAKVLNFLDIAGNWDPSLIFVMGGALAVTFAGFRLAAGRGRPVFDDVFHLPTRRDVDARLLAGATLFGAGWGVAGFCPGPAITSATLGGWPVWAFLIAMFAGFFLAQRTTALLPSGTSTAGR